MQDAERFFGSEAQLRKYPITPGLTGEAALREAQATYVMSEKPTSQHKPVSYVKAHQAHLDTETLDYYKLRWEKDKVAPFVSAFYDISLTGNRKIRSIS